MIEPSPNHLEALWARHHAEWRDPAQIASQWQDAAATDPQLLSYSVQGRWWETLATAGITLLVTREYEHLVLALRATDHGPAISFMRLPHPSGLTVDRKRGIVHIASTRNPNQVYDLAPVRGLLPRGDESMAALDGHPLVPIKSHFSPGCTYIHDLAMVGDVLHANAVGQNVVIRFDSDGQSEPVWWPRCIESDAGLATDRNYLQLNSIAAGLTLETSFFSASTDRISARRPGHRNFAVDKRGVVFSGATREPVVRGLTRPHSARLSESRLWVDNSGYGEVGIVEDEQYLPVAQLPGWTRGLCLRGRTAFVGTSRVIPRFRRYAPGLEASTCVCGVHALDLVSGTVLGSLFWPAGNQIFAIDWVPDAWTTGFPFAIDRKRNADRKRINALFYGFRVSVAKGRDRPRWHRSRLAQNSDATEAGPSSLDEDEVGCDAMHHHAQEGKLVGADFRLLMLSAMYENGGNTTHRFLDGHPQLFVYPFESQLGTRLVMDHLSSLFPAKYRWPAFALDATAEEDYRAIIDEEGKVRARTPRVSKFRHMPFDFSDDERRHRYLAYIRDTGRSRANNVEAFFQATFDAWKDYRRTGEQTIYVGYSPIIVVDAATILSDLPHAHVLHVVRNPWSAYADTKKRPVPLSMAQYMLGWTVNQYHALLFQERFPERMHIVRAEDVMTDPQRTLGAFCERLGLEAATTLATPTWNGTKLDEIYPWGTIRQATPEANLATAKELSTHEREEVRAYAWQYLDVFDYHEFLRQ